MGVFTVCAGENQNHYPRSIPDRPKFLRAYVDWKHCRACGDLSGGGLVRMYRVDGSEEIGTHGEPNINWEWACHATRLGDTVIIELAKNRPPGLMGLMELGRLAHENGFEMWGWERSDKRGERVKLFPIYRGKADRLDREPPS